MYINNKEQEQEYVKFGSEGSEEVIIGVIRGNGMIDEMAVVDNIDVNLVSVRELTEKGMKTTFVDNNVYIRHKGKVVIEGIYNPKIKMYEIDLEELLEMQAPQGAEAANANDKKGTADPTRDAYKTAKIRFTAREVRAARELHRTFKCVPYATLADIVEAGIWAEFVDPCITPALLRELGRKKDCLICAETRWNQVEEVGTGVTKWRPGQAFTFDYLGKVKQRSHGCHGACLISDLGCGYLQLYGMRDSKTAVMEAVRKWVLLMLSYGHRPQAGWCDSGSVETGQMFKEAMQKLGIQQLTTPPYVPNKRIERMVQLLLNDIAATIRCTPHFKPSNWLDAGHDAVTRRSFIPNEASRQWSETQTPYEQITHQKPDMLEYMTNGPGSIVVVKTPAKDKRMGKAKNQVAMVLRTNVDGSKNAQVQILDSGVICRRGKLQVVHVEAPQPTRREHVRKVTISKFEEDVEVTVAAEGGEGPLKVEELITKQDQHLDDQVKAEDAEIAERIRQSSESEKETDDASKYVDSPLASAGYFESLEAEHNDTEVEEYLTRVLTAIQHKSDAADQTDSDEERHEWSNEAKRLHEAKEYWESNEDIWPILTQKQVNDIMLVYEMTGQYPDLNEQCSSVETKNDKTDRETTGKSPEPMEPRSTDTMSHLVLKARQIRGPDNPTLTMLERDPSLQKEWAAAMQNEYEGMCKVSEEIDERTAKGIGITRKVTDCKTKRDGTKKVRMNVDGRAEKQRGAFNDLNMLYSPAMEEKLLKMLIEYAAYYRLHMEKSDVEKCFLNNDMEEAIFKREIVMEFKPVESGKQTTEFRKLNVVGYGTCDAGREWYRRFNQFMITEGFLKSLFFPCLYRKLIGTTSILIVGVATDDMLKICTDDQPGHAAMAQFNKNLDNKWKVKHSPEVGDILGVEIIREESSGSIRLLQPAQIAKMQKTYYPEGTPRTIIPFPKEYDKPNRTMQEPYPDVRGYQKALGDTAYCRITRHDILIYLSKLAERNTQPRLVDWEALLTLIAYTITTHKVGLQYNAGPVEANVRDIREYEAWADASWGTDNHHSQLGLATYPKQAKSEGQETRPYSAAIWAQSSKEKGVVSESVTVAELKAQMKVTADIEIIRGVAEELAGLADGTTTDSVPEGTTEPTQLTSTISTEEIAQAEEAENHPPTDTHLDNASLAIVLNLEITNKAKALRRISRWLHYMISRVQERLIRVVSVKTKDQLANPLTKITYSPTQHWREAEWIQGSQPAIVHMQKVARVAIRQRRDRTSPPKTVHEIGSQESKQEEDETEDNEHNETNVNTSSNATITKETETARKQAREAKRKRKLERDATNRSNKRQRQDDARRITIKQRNVPRTRRGKKSNIKRNELQ